MIPPFQVGHLVGQDRRPPIRFDMGQCRVGNDQDRLPQKMNIHAATARIDYRCLDFGHPEGITRGIQFLLEPLRCLAARVGNPPGRLRPPEKLAANEEGAHTPKGP